MKVLPNRKKPVKAKTSPSKNDYEDLGRMLATLYETGYVDRTRFYKMTFIKGVLQGFGGVIGATILVALLLWFLTFFDNIPVIDDFVRRIERTVNQPPM